MKPTNDASVNIGVKRIDGKHVGDRSAVIKGLMLHGGLVINLMKITTELKLTETYVDQNIAVTYVMKHYISTSNLFLDLPRVRLDGGRQAFRRKWGYELAPAPPLLEEDEDLDLSETHSLREETLIAYSALDKLYKPWNGTMSNGQLREVGGCESVRKIILLGNTFSELPTDLRWKKILRRWC
uniref:Uncharacterized protein n=1 Tax=Strigamia maritima TaxID=126957 RepID=T1IJS2_STRMM